MSAKDEIIDKFSSLHPGLMEMLMVLQPDFDTFYMDEDDVLHLVDKHNRKAISVWKENNESLVLQVITKTPILQKTTSWLLRITLAKDLLNPTSDNTLDSIAFEKNRRIELDVD